MCNFFVVLVLCAVCSSASFARDNIHSDHDALFNAKGFICNFSSGSYYFVNDRYEFTIETAARAEKFTIIVHNFSSQQGTALFGSAERTQLTQAHVVSLGGAVAFFVDYPRGITLMTIFAKKEPSNGRFFAAFTEQGLLPIISDPTMYAVTGTCVASD
jgi:hypothetical protein